MLGSAEIRAAADIIKQIKQHGHEKILAAMEQMAAKEEAKANGAANG